MSKSILVMDTPDNCIKCKLRYDNYGECEICILADDIIDYFYATRTKPEWCPLLPLPEKKDMSHYIQSGDAKSKTHLMQYIHDQGWNDCLEEILKEN